MFSLHRSAWIALFALTLAPGCVIDTQPQPEGEDRDAENPRPGDNGASADAPDFAEGSGEFLSGVGIFHSGETDGSSPRLVIGLPGTISDSAATYRLSNLTRANAGVLEKAPAADGSFAAAFDAVAGETVALELFAPTAAADDPPIDATSVVLFAASNDAARSSADAAASIADAMTPAASPPGGNGFSTVVLPPGSVDPGVEFVVANLTAGAAASGVSAADGSLSISVEAVSGDQLELFAIDRAMNNGGGPSTTVNVP